MTRSISRHSSRRFRNPPDGDDPRNLIPPPVVTNHPETDPPSSLFQPPAPPQHNLRPSAQYINVAQEPISGKTQYTNPPSTQTKEIYQASPGTPSIPTPKAEYDLESATTKKKPNNISQADLTCDRQALMDMRTFTAQDSERERERV